MEPEESNLPLAQSNLQVEAPVRDEPDHEGEAMQAQLPAMTSTAVELLPEDLELQISSFCESLLASTTPPPSEAMQLADARSSAAPGT